MTLSGHPLDTSRFDTGWPKSAFWMSFLGHGVFRGVSGAQTKKWVSPHYEQPLRMHNQWKLEIVVGDPQWPGIAFFSVGSVIIFFLRRYIGQFDMPSDPLVSYQYRLSISTLRYQFKGLIFPLYLKLNLMTLIFYSFLRRKCNNIFLRRVSKKWWTIRLSGVEAIHINNINTSLNI